MDQLADVSMKGVGESVIVRVAVFFTVFVVFFLGVPGYLQHSKSVDHLYC